MSNRYLKMMFKITKTGHQIIIYIHLPSPAAPAHRNKLVMEPFRLFQPSKRSLFRQVTNRQEGGKQIGAWTS